MEKLSGPHRPKLWELELLMENGVTARQVALGEPSESRSPGALGPGKSCAMLQLKEGRVSSFLGIVQPRRLRTAGG